MNNIKFSFFYIFAVVFLLSCYILPFVRMQLNMVQLAVLNIIFVLICMIRTKSMKILIHMTTLLVPFLGISFLISTGMSVKYGIIHKYMLFLNMIFPAILSIDLIRRNNKKEIYMILFSMSIMIAYVLIRSYIEIRINPAILREMTAVSVTDIDYVSRMQLEGVGGFGIAYGSGILILSFITLFKFVKNKGVRFVFLFIILSLIVFILNANFTTLLIISIICVWLHLFINSSSSICRMILFGGGGICFIILPQILEFAIGYYGDTSTGNHLSDLLNSLIGKYSYDSERNRITLSLWKSICNSPLWGRNIYDMSSSFLYANSHSTILGCLYSTGIIGLISYLMAIWYVIKYLLKRVGIPNKISLILIVYYLLLGYFNPSESIEVSVCAFMFFPLLSYVILNRYRNAILEK